MCTVQSSSKACCTKAIRSNCWIRSLLKSKNGLRAGRLHIRRWSQAAPGLLCIARFFARKDSWMRNAQTIESYVPARLDALPWSSWHWLIVVSLGATWILDGLEVTLAGALGGVLTRPETLGLSDAQVGATATSYLAGAVIGALLFGYGTDRFGRKKLFFITVAVYLIGTALSGNVETVYPQAVFGFERRLLIQQFDRIAFVQHAFDNDCTVHTSGALMRLRYFFQYRRCSL